MFKRVLIANRGEIAIRIARAAQYLGMESVAVFPHADRASLHTQFATHSNVLTTQAGALPVAGYLDIEQLISVAKKTACDCVHPGYGFLAEHASFAERCTEEGITFIGPTAEVLRTFGDKVASRDLAATLDIPVVPGSDHATDRVEDAAQVASDIGYPVMLKAAAGGGGRGMRVVESDDELRQEFARCSGEAESAFGDGSIFIEKLITDPRHIEVQILADHDGEVAHLFERDCSIQLRHQKVMEFAPAPNLDPELRDTILDHATKLCREAGYTNAGTVEFLVDVQKGECFFIECNPRIQVEHTVTEQITGIDLVEAQFRIADGESLASLGISDQESIKAIDGFSIQARVTATEAGTISGYKEPTGPGIRVDSYGYDGYEVNAQFDPLLAKVVATTTRDFPATLARMQHALGEFQISGIQTNLASLSAICENVLVENGDARTTLLSSKPELINADGRDDNSLIGFLEQSSAATTLVSGSSDEAAQANVPHRSQLRIPEGDIEITVPLESTLVEWSIAEGDLVNSGDPIVVVNAMKMETVISAPKSGRVSAIQTLSVGDQLRANETVAALNPFETTDSTSHEARAESSDWQSTLDQVATLQTMAKERLAIGSEDPGVVRQRNRNKLTCRERIELLLDADSFHEVGSVTGFASYDEEGNIVAFTPANHVGGWGTVEQRTAIVCADDFTSRGGHADGAIGAKSSHLDRLSIEMRVPSVRLLDGSSGGGSVAAMVPQQKQEGESTAKESTGAIKSGRPRVAGGGGSFLPGHLGSAMYTQQLATVPVVNMLLGSVVGIGAAKAVLGHFSVMVRDIAQLFVAGPPVVQHAMGYDITKEELGDWRVHCKNGSVDNLAESEADAAAMVRRFLSYLPSSVYEAPPITSCNDPDDRREDDLFTIIPRKRTTTFDIRHTINLIVDKDSFFEIGGLWGTDQVTGLARFAGHPVGVIASDSQHVNGGALTAAGCRKLTRHLDLCDLFHLPVLNLVDNPGFAVGLEHEIAGTIRAGGEWMVAFSQVKIPIFTVVMRRSFGVAGNNYATPRSAPSMRVAWPAADTGGIPPEGGIEAAYRRQLAEAEDPEALRAELNARIESARGPLGPLSKFQIEEMIDPRDTRRYVCEWVRLAYRLVALPDQLHSRELQFRP
ncbi:MAG: ATP-grasp domain-containing protein [Gammaproteobacteria bacterium]|nr:ATP-grasp domain-containing protein [Gammaproteobacteria bacterium]